MDGQTYPSLGSRDRRQLAMVQYVWQESRETFDRSRPVLDQVARTAIRLRRLSRSDARAETLALLDSFGLTDRQARRRPGDLSGGQLRRASLARALIARPTVLLCDEPTTGLDPQTSQSILDHLDEYRRSNNASVLVLGHDLGTLLPRTDRILALDHGRVTDDLAAADVAGAEASPQLRLLLAAEGLHLHRYCRQPGHSGK